MQRRRVALSSILGLAVGGFAYAAILLDFGWSPTRTAIQLRYASNFFDLQADALLQGRLDVAPGSLGIEGFVVDGRTFMYFPPFPALVRLPVMLVTRAFDGYLTVASMALAWLVFAIFAARLLWLVRSLIHPDLAVSRLEAFGMGVLLAAISGGTVLTFDASLPWVYHEVYLWSAATVIGTLYWLIRATARPSTWTIGWTGAFALAAVLTRTTGGLAVCGAIVLAALWAARRARKPGQQFRITRPVVLLAAAGLGPMLAGITLNLAKFKHPYMFPLELQVWSQVNEHRREALIANGGTITGPQFLPTTLRAYFAPNGLRFTDYFPWVSLPAKAPAPVGDVVFDQTYRTASVTATTPLLLALALVGTWFVLRRLRTPVGRLLTPSLVGAAAVGGGVLMYGYLSNRYTSEFVPYLTMGTAVAAGWLLPTLPQRRVGIRRGAIAALVVLTAYSIAVQMALGYREASVVGGGAQLHGFLTRQTNLSGGPGSGQAAMVARVDALPTDAPTDTLAIVGPCDSLFLATGDTYNPWALVESQPLVFDVTAPRDLGYGTIPLATVAGTIERQVNLQTRDDNHVRLVVTEPNSVVAGPWVGVYPGTSIRVGLSIRSELGHVEVSSLPGGHVALIPWTRIDADWVILPGIVTVSPALDDAAQALRMTIRRAKATPLPLCERLAASAS